MLRTYPAVSSSVLSLPPTQQAETEAAEAHSHTRPSHHKISQTSANHFPCARRETHAASWMRKYAKAAKNIFLSVFLSTTGLLAFQLFQSKTDRKHFSQTGRPREKYRSLAGGRGRNGATWEHFTLQPSVVVVSRCCCCCCCCLLGFLWYFYHNTPALSSLCPAGPRLASGTAAYIPRLFVASSTSANISTALYCPALCARVAKRCSTKRAKRLRRGELIVNINTGAPLARVTFALAGSFTSAFLFLAAAVVLLLSAGACAHGGERRGGREGVLGRRAAQYWRPHGIMGHFFGYVRGA